MPTKVFIVDEVQRITQGWDVLLKTLEEPPPHVLFIFCTTDSSQIRPAVVSRVQRFDFRPLPLPLIEGKLDRILAADGRIAEPEAVALVARLAGGGMRDAESILDQLLSAGGDVLTADAVRDVLGLADEETVRGYGRALVVGDPAGGIAVLDALEDRGRDLRSFADQVVESLRAALHLALAGRPAADPLAALGVGPLASAARRLATIDPARPGPGGLRLSLELALFDPLASAGGTPATSSPFALPPTSLPSPSPAVIAADALAAEAAPAPVSPARPSAARRAAAAPAAELPAAPSTSGKPAGGPGPEPAAEPAPEAAPVPARAPAAESGAEAALVPARAPAAESGAEPVAPGAVPGPASDDPLAELRLRWPEIVTLISRHPPTKPLIEACRPIAVDGAVVTLGFPESQLFLREVADRRRKTLEDGVGHVLGRPVSVRCVATNLDLEATSSPDPESAAVLRAARDVWGDELVEIPEVH